MPLPTDFVLAYGDLATAATRYDDDGASNPTSVQVVITNLRNLQVSTARGDRLIGRVPPGTIVVPGQVLQVPSFSIAWYLVVTTLQRSVSALLDAGTVYALLALPGTLTVQSVVPSTPPLRTNPYNEPAYLTSAGYPAGDTAEVTVRCGVSNQFDPLSESIAGPLPAGVVTVYVPLGTVVAVGASVVDLSVPGTTDATAYVVQQVNRLYADGTAYALQLILDSGAGAGWAPSS